MFPNKELAQHINRSEVLKGMLKELPWNTLRNLVQSNTRIHKRCTIGGHRLDTKWRERIEKIFVQEAEKEDFPHALCNAVFVYWYPQQGELYDQLEKHFNSEEYQKFLKDNEYNENDYILTDEEFDRFFSVSDLRQWRALLCFSPLKLTEDQARKILDSTQGNQELLAQLEERDKALEEKESEIARLNNELESARARLDHLNKEVQQLRRQNKDQKQADSNASKQLAAVQKERQRLQRQVEEAEEKAENIRQESEKELLRKTKVLQDELNRRNQELKDWRNKYENQCAKTRELNEKIGKLEKTLGDERIVSDKNRKEIKRSHRFVDLLVERLDWTEIGRKIKLTPQLKLRFNNLIRSLHYDENNKPKINTSLEKFWNQLQKQEKELIENIAKSDTLEVESGTVEDFWSELEDSFEDVQISLEARTILIQILRQIFYQTLEMKDLQQDVIPSSMSRTGKKS